MSRIPHLLRREGDPLDAARVVVTNFESVARTARKRFLHASDHASTTRLGRIRVASTTPAVRPPLLVMAASGVDGLRIEQLDADGVAPLDDIELQLAASRAGLDGFDLRDGETERIRGALTALRGSVGEHWVLDRLRSRHLPIPERAVAVEMLPFTTPGVDLVFTDATGATVGSANVKVAGTANVVMRHFDRHPDVTIVYATSDAAADAAVRGIHVVGPGGSLPTQVPVVIDIGRDSSDFDHQIRDTLAGSTNADGWDLVDLMPWTSTAVIGIRALLRLQAGLPRQDIARLAGREATAASAATSAAHLASRLTNSEPSVALIAMATSAIAFGALDVRHSWTTLTTPLSNLATLAEQTASRASRTWSSASEGRPSWT
jgi:hypothetical protein